MIPAEAVEAAAWVLYLEDHLWGESWETSALADKYRTAAHIALEAAAPHILADVNADALRAAWDRGYAMAIDGMKDIPAKAWDEGANAAWERSTPEVNGAHYVWRSEGDPVNPYRTTA